MAPTQAMIGPTLEHSYVRQSTERDCRGRTRGGGDKDLFVLHWFFYTEFEDAQAPTQVQWHDAEFELTVKFHLTDRTLLCARTVGSVSYYLNHTDHPPNAPFLHAVSPHKSKQNCTSWQWCSFIFSTRVYLVKQDDPKIYEYRRRKR